MTKSQLKKVLSLHNEGVPPHTCTLAILQMAFRDQKVDGFFLRDVAKSIDAFYSTVIDVKCGNCSLAAETSTQTPAERAVGALVELGMDAAEALDYVISIAGVE